MRSIPQAFLLERLATVASVVLLALSLTAAATGILLSFYYEPAAGEAYNSLKAIATEIPNGWIFLNLHDIAGNGVIVVSLIQIVIMFLGRQSNTNWFIAWVSGILLTLSAMALAWTAMILDWTEIGYWRLKIELGIVASIPLIGAQLRDILTGGGAVGTATVERLYTIHSYILSVGAIALAVVHLASLLLQEKGLRVKVELEADPAAPDSEVELEQTEKALY